MGDDGEESDFYKDRKEKIRKILNDYEIDTLKEQEPEREFGHISSREYQEYKETEERRRRKNKYMRLVDRLGVFEYELGGTQQKLEEATDLLGWKLNTKKVFAAGLIISVLVLIASIAIFLLEIPLIFKIGAFSLPFVALFYFIRHPIYQAQRKVITSSDELIISILYMVIYMRNSPNLEGAVRFAALNTEGAISQDFKRVLWQTEVGEYTSVHEALTDYAKKWRPYNKDFIESIELLVEATSEGDSERREQILGESIDNLLEGTREKMKRYARELRMPVSATFGIGILLPVLGMILFPLVASFMGGKNLEYYLAFIYNFFLPVVLYLIIRHTLIKRPPTVSTQKVDSELLPKKGFYTITIAGRDLPIPAIAIALLVFAVIGAWPIMYYGQVLMGDAVLPPKLLDVAAMELEAVKGITDVGVQVNENTEKIVVDTTAFTMLRSLLLTLAFSVSAGVYFYLGNVQRIKKLKEVEAIEDEFPEALFQLGNALGRGSPIETGIRKAIGNMQQMQIADMFKIMEYNMNEIGMTFEQAIFDGEYGALRHYPSKLIESVMRAINQSSHKGTKIVAMAMMNISTYLKNIYQTEEEIAEQLSETLATMSFLAFILAPVISGVALGLGSIITKSLFALKRFKSQMDIGNNLTTGQDSNSALPSGARGMQSGSDSPLQTFNLEHAVPPDILQIVIGIYLFQLALLIGMFYVRLTEGENPIIRKMFTGKILIVMPILYAITTLILVGLFGGMIAGTLSSYVG